VKRTEKTMIRLERVVVVEKQSRSIDRQRAQSMFQKWVFVVENVVFLLDIPFLRNLVRVSLAIHQYN